MSKPKRDPMRPERDEVTEASIESFPASDPPAFNASTPSQRRKRGERDGSAGPDRVEAEERPTTAQVRGDIPSGRTMGVSSAAEPSAAPFDTDDEAAGRAASTAAMRTTLADEARGGGVGSRGARVRAPAGSTRNALIAVAVIALLLVLVWLWIA